MRRSMILVLLTGGILAGLSGLGANDGDDVAARPVTQRRDLSPEEERTIRIFRETAPAVVHVTSVAVRRNPFTFDLFQIPQGTGTGLVWDRDGHVVTNFHVIRGANQVRITLSDQTSYPAEIVGVAPHKDLAVLKFDLSARELEPISIGTSHDLVVGQQVYAIGNPFGLDHTLTTGVISGLGREIESVTRRPIQGVIQTDAAINAGNSGGPLLDSSGRLIGINTAIYSPSGAFAGVGFAVPVNTVQRIVPQLVQHGRVIRPGLGVRLVDDVWAARFGVDGVVVAAVTRGSAAERAGLRGARQTPSGRIELGDVITRLDDRSIRSNDDLFRALDQYEVGDRVSLTVDRAGRSRQVAVTLQEIGR
ncbi:MAG: trypsin-like peptidase domain-containing protein [Myxococcota bacterium]